MMHKENNIEVRKEQCQKEMERAQVQERNTEVEQKEKGSNDRREKDSVKRFKHNGYRK